MTRVRLACALVAALVAGCSAEEDGARPHVLVVVVDTLRADALGVYGSSVGDSPELDAFAETASVYSRASTPRAKTNPAVASLMTGSACSGRAPGGNPSPPVESGQSSRLR